MRTKKGTLGDLLRVAGVDQDMPQSEVKNSSRSDTARGRPASSDDPVKTRLKDLMRRKEEKPAKPRRDLILGLDFGTSSFKVIIRDPELGKAFAIPLVHGKAGLPAYLMPTAFSITSDGEWVWSGGERIIPNPKADLLTLVAKGEQADDVVAVATLACAAALRAALAEFGRQFGDQYKGVVTRWEINVGAPLQGKSNDHAVTVFRKIGAAAYLLGMVEGSKRLTLSNVKEALSGRYRDHMARINVRPEVVSEVHGYRNSPQRLEGLHALVDVGATTVDVSTFVIHRRHDGDDGFEILAAEVRPEGVHTLKDNRLNSAIESLKSLRSGHVATDPTEPPRDIEKFEKLISLLVKNADRAIARRVRTLFVDVLRTTKQRRYPNSPEWQSGVRVFLCGGGKDVEAYRADIQNLVSKGMGRGVRLKLQALPTPADLEFAGDAIADYDRLAVAYGLSYPHIDFGVVNFPESIADISKAQQVVEDRREHFCKEVSAD